MSVEQRGETELAKASVVSRMLASQKRQARGFVADVVRMRGLMPLLMKNRNGDKWTANEKSELLDQLRVLSRVSPYLLFLLLPGSALLLPVYAWWLDRRRVRRAARPVSETLP
ncbi:conserved hypothetical protein [Candidatus Propionivibrio aalborgensis]|uniref:Uncharacterized protein n=1 Tax=Candidatus Propionivibrio aalborgensis TaxID=1860101 RepID=A0A1A8XHW1_9RHOO|nr:conserved hypothetical protein [Candidatus Propionivibrio aalborgensis]